MLRRQELVSKVLIPLFEWWEFSKLGVHAEDASAQKAGLLQQLFGHENGLHRELSSVLLGSAGSLEISTLSRVCLEWMMRLE
jgi:hypothetical protein